MSVRIRIPITSNADVVPPPEMMARGVVKAVDPSCRGAADASRRLVPPFTVTGMVRVQVDPRCRVYSPALDLLDVSHQSPELVRR